MSVHPSEQAELELAARRRVLAWAASEGLRVTPGAADRLVTALRGNPDASNSPDRAEPAPTASVVAMAAYRPTRLRSAP